MIAEVRAFLREWTALATELREYVSALRAQTNGPAFDPGPKPEDAQRSLEADAATMAETAKLFADVPAGDPFGTGSGFVDLETATKNYSANVAQQQREATEAIESYTLPVETLTAKGATVSDDGRTVSWPGGKKYPRPVQVPAAAL